jgi:hypothetical protein
MDTYLRLWKCLAVGIILVFLGTCIIPSIAQDREKLSLPTSRGNWSLSPFDHPSWQWAVSTEGTFYNNGYSISIDTIGNLYITGGFSKEASFGSTTLISSGESDVFVSKLNKYGTWLWTVRAGGSGEVKSSDICLDSSGNIYIVGYFQGNASFGSTTLTSSGSYDVFVAKLNTKGDWLWAVGVGGSDDDKGYGIDVDSSGNTYVTGYFAGNASFGSTILRSSGLLDVFVMMLNSSGVWQWAICGGGTEADFSWNICVDPSRNTYVIGYFQGNASFGSTIVTSNNYEEVFVAKVNSNGEWQWVVSAGGIHMDLGLGIDMDSSGNIYVTGEFSDIASFGSTTLTSRGHQDVFVAKLNNSGEWQWAVGAGGSWADSGLSVCVDSHNDIYVTGIFLGTTVKFGNTTLASNVSSFDVFVTKLDNNGEWLWAMRGGGSGHDTGYSISTDSNNNTYVTGAFSGHAMFGSTALTLNGDYFNVFVAKLRDSGGGNQAPNTPSLQGESMGEVGIPYEYIFFTKDPEGDNVYYSINWSDGTPETSIGPFSSGDQAKATHTWSVKGIYVIKAKSRDIYDAESDWGTLSVIMPYSYNISLIQFWNQLFERFLNAFPLVRQLLGY